MILIDKPYISDFLIKTIKENNFEIVATKSAKELIKDDSLNWVSEEKAISTIKKDSRNRVYTNSENSLSWVFDNLKETNLPKQIQLFKDKFKFRELVKDIYPEFFFKIVKFEEIQDLNLKEITFPFVIKPSLGFFSIGVKIIHNKSDWNKAKKELNNKNLHNIYPKDVMDISTFIIEEYIEGEEYAIDCYFDNNGDAVILNILHHKFSSGTDVSDRVYSTSKSIILNYKEAIEDFLKPIGKKANLKNFPLHIEIRIDSIGNMKPIEVNPLRFGGWCTTADLTWYSYGFNAYEYYIKNKKPNWEHIFGNRKDKIYSIIVLNNNSGYKVSEISFFDFDRIEKDLENVLVVRQLDIKKDPVFGFLFIETSLGNEEELNKILNSNLTKYIK
ncbi:MAG: ATP-grasp domain-containing protein [Flavobacteriaceae bacterium]|nr:ATP-grasp domain-containing protein [Flavobacteriaceae bacterium]